MKYLYWRQEEGNALCDAVSLDGMGVVIEDRKGFGFWRNFSIGIFKAQMPVVNNCYPESLYRIYIVNAEFMLKVM